MTFDSKAEVEFLFCCNFLLFFASFSNFRKFNLIPSKKKDTVRKAKKEEGKRKQGKERRNVSEKEKRGGRKKGRKETKVTKRKTSKDGLTRK